MLFLQSERTRDAWSYLISAQDPFTNRSTWEEKAMPKEVAAYLLARQQQSRTLGSAHRPGYGEAGVRAEGVEKAEATAGARYVEGFTPGLLAQGAKPRSDAHSRVAAHRASIESARRGAQSTGAASNPTERTVNELLQDMERYLDEYFASNDEAARRIAGVLRIANYEYQVAKRFMEQLKPEKLAKALALAATIQSLLWAIARFGGYIGQALSKLSGSRSRRWASRQAQLPSPHSLSWRRRAAPARSAKRVGTPTSLRGSQTTSARSCRTWP